MKKIVNFCNFCDAFANAGRYYQFSYKAKKALFDYLEEINPDYQLDIIGLCCSFVEYDDLQDFNKQNDTEYESWDDVDSFIARVGNDGALCHV